MALSRATLVPLSLGGLMVVSLALAGCPNAASSSIPKEEPIGASRVVRNGQLQELIVDGTVYGQADLTTDATIKADEPNLDSDIGLFRVLQLSGPNKAVENASVTLKGYDFKVLPLMPTKATNEQGKFKFRSVPSRVAFFLDTTYTLGGKTYREFGLVRTGDVTESTLVDVDVSSTLVARFLLRLMQYCGTPSIANHPIDFRDLDPKDYKPLLDDLRNLLAGGMPQGMPLDLTKVKEPDGDWTAAKDKADAAVVFLDGMRGTSQAQYKQIEFDMRRLADAVATDAKLFSAPNKPLDILPPVAR
jgi:hypothetical protein